MKEAARNHYDVIITGGGPVGMGLAIDLGQRGIRTAVIEPYAEPQPVPKGQNLTQRTLEHFMAWQCEAELRAARITPRTTTNGGLTAYGTLLSGYWREFLLREKVGAFYNTDVERLPQYATEKVLRARASGLAPVNIHYGYRVEGIGTEGERVTVHAHPAQGHADTAPLALTCDWLVGCDGSHSTIREAAGITQTKRDHDRKMALLVFRSPELHALLEALPPRAFYNTLHPDLQGYWQFLGRVDMGEQWFFHAPVPMDAGRDNFDFKALLHRVVGKPFAMDFTYIGFWDLRFAIADTYRRGRVLLAGDAAHSHPPYGGYGINTGFEDARNLGWKLAAFIKGHGGMGLVDSYDAERRPVFASTADDFIENFIFADRDFLAKHSPEKDGEGFRAAWDAHFENDHAVLNYEPNYEGSPVIAPMGGKAAPSARGMHVMEARPGHHLAPQPLADGRMSFEALDPGAYTVFADGGRMDMARDFARRAAGMNCPSIIAPPLAPEAVAAYAADFIITRPDQYVAWVGGIRGRDEADAIIKRLAG